MYLYSERLTKTYSSSVIVQPQATTDPQAILSGGGTTGNLAGVASLAGTPSVVAEAARIQHKPISSIRGVTASSDEDTGFVTIEVGGERRASSTQRGPSPRRSARLLQGQGRQADKRGDSKRRAPTAKETSEAQRNTLQDQLQRSDGPGRAGPNLQVVEPLVLARSSRLNRAALLALIAALLIGAGLMVLVERFDRKLRKPEELEPLADVPLLGTIPYAAFPGGEPDPRPVRPSRPCGTA